MNEIILVDKIEKKLQEPREQTVFPLTPTHRKELRKLRDDNIGELNSRLNVIRKLKREEYVQKYQKQIQKELDKHITFVKKLNQHWVSILEDIKKLLSDRKEFEKKNKDKISLFELSHSWHSISELKMKDFSEYRRNYSLDTIKVSKKIAEEEFDKKYGESFKKSQEEIDKLHTMYEEAINFGDLEIVKEIYYRLKKADSFFKKVSDLKI